MKLLQVAKKSVCLIKTKYKGMITLGTGFFIEFPTENGVLHGLITNNHVLKRKHLFSKSDPIFNIYFEEEREFHINSQDMNFIFSEKLIDITFIQLNDELIKKINPCFLTIDNRKCTEKESVLIIQYHKLVNGINDNQSIKYNKSILQEPSVTSGSIEYLSGINYYHSCSTYKGSSGSPLVNNSLKVIGIHKSFVREGNRRCATNINIVKYVISTAYKRKNENDIKNIRKLSQEYLEDLYNHNLKQMSKRLFKYSGNDSIPSLFFYRTNHAWYWTDNNIKKDDLKSLSQLKWTIIIPHEEVNNESLKPIHKNLIMWLKLSEFMYL